jgi:predicted AAA+ superfamily ATPase
VREIKRLESLAGLYLSNISTLQSFNRLKGAVGLSLEVERFSRYLELAGMFLFTKKFEFSLKKQLRSLRKVYVIDPGFFQVKGFKISENFGRILENVVAVELFEGLPSPFGRLRYITGEITKGEKWILWLRRARGSSSSSSAATSGRPGCQEERDGGPFESLP